MVWTVIRSDRFSEEFKKFEKNKHFVYALDAKIKRLQEDPNIGGYLSGRLHGYKSIRLVGKYRIVFRIDEKEKKVYLVAIDHRGHDYERF
ncbi:MAG: type II toxin-antitoxin system RelE/ParE family toxin [Nanoarchaeota archaeon]